MKSYSKPFVRTLALALPCACLVALSLTATAQSIAPGTGRHIKRNKTSVLAKALNASSQQAQSASESLHNSQDAQHIAKAQVANEKLNAVALQASGIVRSDLVKAITDQTAKVNDAIVANSGNPGAQAAATAPPLAVAAANAANASDAATQLVNADNTKPTSWILPTTLKKDENRYSFLGTDSQVTNAYFNADGPLAFVTKIKYNYSESSTIGNLSSDLVAMQFPYVGFQLALGGNITNKPATANASSGATPPPSSTPTATSVQQAIQELTQGGDFYLKWTLPLVYTPPTNAIQIQAFATSLMGFETSGQNTQNTVNTASRVNENFAGEGYFQWDALPEISSNSNSAESLGSIFADARIGWQKISTGEAANAGLGSVKSYRLGQIALGIVFNGYATISAQRYWGPEQAYVGANNTPVTVNNFNKWQISVQITPSVASGKQ
jgi:hypothetical protein